MARRRQQRQPQTPAAHTDPLPGALAPGEQGHGQRPRVYLVATLALYAILQFLYITATPLQEITLPDNLPQNAATKSLLVGLGPDEKEHFLYILSLAERAALPAPSPAFRASPDQYVTYQAQHPPLFYALAAALYRMVAPLFGMPFTWYFLRFVCAVFGGIVVVLAARAARLAFPDRPVVFLAAAPFVAFLPMFGHMCGNLSNEPMAMALGAWAWLQMVRMARSENPPTPRDAALLGVTLGLAALTRLTALLWLPAAALILGFVVLRRSPPRSLIAPAAFATCFFLLFAPWLLRNQIAFGTPFLRTFDRPLLASGTLGDFFGAGIVPKEFPVPVTAFSTVLWYASTAWLPFWLVQFYMPGGGLAAAAGWQRIFLALSALAALGLLLHAARRRDPSASATPDDPVGRVILRAAAGALLFCLAALIQQQLYSDWNVVLSAGRYIVAAVPATALLFLFALSTFLERRRNGGGTAAAAAIAAAMLVFGFSAALLVRQFYRDHPAQAPVQPIVQAASR